MTPLLLALPWAGVLAFLLLATRLPRALPPAASVDVVDAPLVSIIVPARNEEVNIETCLRSLTASSYPRFEVLVVDDRSGDATAALAAAVSRGNATRLEVLAGTELPPGWLGKPWACQQGADAARGELLLFTDADTTHGPELLTRALAGMREERADLLTVMGRQLMESFWERLVQPQIFLTMLFRFPDFEKTNRSARWRDAIANGQFMLFSRTAYDALGGHVAVQDEVVEDLVMAQIVKREGYRLRVRSAEDALATRMYRSLGELVAGWTKNIIMGGLQSVSPTMRPLLPPVALATGIVLWLMPPAVLAGVLMTGGAGGWLVWSAAVCALSVAVWACFMHGIGGRAWYALLYPLGAAVVTYVFLRSWIRGRDVEWKGRRYRLKSASERA